MNQEGAAIQTTPSGVRISVHAQPGAKRTEVVGFHGASVKIRVQAPPLEGRANDELIRFIASGLDVSRTQVRLIRGDKSRAKVFEVSGPSVTDVRSWLGV